MGAIRIRIIGQTADEASYLKKGLSGMPFRESGPVSEKNQVLREYSVELPGDADLEAVIVEVDGETTNLAELLRHRTENLRRVAEENN